MTPLEASRRLIERGPVLLGVDFDGTLAPIVSQPNLATPHPGALGALASLTGTVDVAVMSGRSLADLKERLGDQPGMTLVGEHGNDIGGTAERSPLIETAGRLLDAVASELPGSEVESKKLSVAFHYRNATSEPSQALHRIRDWASQQEGLKVLGGKKVIELSVARWNKGDAIKKLAGDSGIIYLGDDTTDETVFAVLGSNDVGIKVGPGDTLAAYRLDGVPAVAQFLRELRPASG